MPPITGYSVTPIGCGAQAGSLAKTRSEKVGLIQSALRGRSRMASGICSMPGANGVAAEDETC
jgi:hypothetical protein